MDLVALTARALVTFTQYFLGIGYLLWALGRFSSVVAALSLVEALLLLVVGAVGCYYQLTCLGRWLTTFEGQRQARRRKAA
jgi:hypothetical protein